MTHYNFSFTGSSKEYFKIWIVNILLTIITLGVYSAWATVRNKRYFHGNTWLANENFEYHATPKQILFGRLIAIALLATYLLLSQFTPILGFAFAFLLMLGSPWIIWRSMQFNARMSSYQNVRFAFSGSLNKAYKYLLIIPLAPIVLGAVLSGAAYLAFGTGEKTMLITGISATVAFTALYAMVLFLNTLLDTYYINNSHYGNGQFKADLDVGEYYIIYLKWLGLSFLAFFGAFLGFALLGAIVAAAFTLISGGDFENMFSGETMGPMIGMGAVLGIYIPILLAGMFLNAYLKSRLRNYSFNQTALDGKVLDLKSAVKARKLFFIYLGNTFLIILTFGLAIPWAKIRLARYTAASTSADIDGDITQYVSQQRTHQTSLGDELGDAFDVAGGFEVGM